MQEVISFVDSKKEEIERLTVSGNEAYWAASISGKKEDYDKYSSLQEKLQNIFNNKEDFITLKKIRELSIKDETLKRNINVLYLSYLSAQGDPSLLRDILKKSTEIEHVFSTYRVIVNGKAHSDNEINEILKSELDSKKLKVAWESSKMQGETISKDLIDLVKLRNTLARNNGFVNYYEMALFCSEQNEKDISEVFNSLYEQTKQPFGALKKEIDTFICEKYNVSAKELRPWHYQDLFFQEGPEIYNFDLDTVYKDVDILAIAKDFYKSIGFDVSFVLKNSDLYEKDGKNQHAYCINIDRQGDVRILENLKINEKWIETTLHELGHAIYFKNINLDLPFILRDHAHIFVTESIAMFFGRLSKNIDFIKRYCNPPSDSLDALDYTLKNKLRLRQLVFARWAMVMMNFEKELYSNPDQNLNTLWWQLVSKYQLIDFSRDKPDWASKIHFIMSPVYYHNYLLGEILASQIDNQIISSLSDDESNKDYYGNKKIGEFLIQNIFSKGALYDWDKLIREAFGEKLNPKYFVKQFVS